MTMAPALKSSGIGGALFIVAAFYAFFALSCIILIIMEGVSAMVSWTSLVPQVKHTHAHPSPQVRSYTTVR